MSRNSSASSKEFLDIQANIECGFTLKRVRDMIRTYSVRIYFENCPYFKKSSFAVTDIVGIQSVYDRNEFNIEFGNTLYLRSAN